MSFVNSKTRTSIGDTFATTSDDVAIERRAVVGASIGRDWIVVPYRVFVTRFDIFVVLSVMFRCTLFTDFDCRCYFRSHSWSCYLFSSSQSAGNVAIGGVTTKILTLQNELSVTECVTVGVANQLSAAVTGGDLIDITGAGYHDFVVCSFSFSIVAAIEFFVFVFLARVLYLNCHVNARFVFVTIRLTSD